MKEIKPGQLWWDKNHKWCNGDDLDTCFLILSGDIDDSNKMLYKCAQFMWIAEGYCGANIREFYEPEIRMMEYAGNISSIKSFKWKN
jgi:hypothetical protein